MRCSLCEVFGPRRLSLVEPGCARRRHLAYNTASSGAYVEDMLKKIGASDEIQGKLVRLFRCNAVMRRLVEGKGKEFGFGGITNIVLNCDKGVRLVAGRDSELHELHAALIAISPNAPSARAIMTYLASLRPHFVCGERHLGIIRHPVHVTQKGARTG